MKIILVNHRFYSTFIQFLRLVRSYSGKAVKKALAGYLHSGDTNDPVALDRFMHPDFRVAFYDGEEGGIKIVDRATYSSLIGNKTFGGYERTVDYHSIH